jgi:hypothetical protein
LQQYAASRISSAIECFAEICRDRRHHLNPTVGLLPVRLESKKIILMCAKDGDKVDVRLNQPSLLERYFSRPIASRYDRLTYAQYFSLFQSTKREQGDGDQCFRSKYIVKDGSFKDRG